MKFKKKHSFPYLKKYQCDITITYYDFRMKKGKLPLLRKSLNCVNVVPVSCYSFDDVTNIGALD